MAIIKLFHMAFYKKKFLKRYIFKFFTSFSKKSEFLMEKN